MIHWNLCREASTGHLGGNMYLFVCIDSQLLGQDLSTHGKSRSTGRSWSQVEGLSFSGMAMLPTPHFFNEVAICTHWVINGIS